MLKSTAITILRRYDNYAIVTVGRPDICDKFVESSGRHIYDRVHLVYLWDMDRPDRPFEGGDTAKNPIRDAFTLSSLTDLYEASGDGLDFSPWSEKGDLGYTGFTGLYALMPPDMGRVFRLLSNRVTRKYVEWGPDDDLDRDALRAGGRYAAMGDWSPTGVVFDPVANALVWDCAAGAECRRRAEAAGFRLTWEVAETVQRGGGSGLMTVARRWPTWPLEGQPTNGTPPAAAGTGAPAALAGKARVATGPAAAIGMLRDMAIEAVDAFPYASLAGQVARAGLAEAVRNAAPDLLSEFRVPAARVAAMEWAAGFDADPEWDELARDSWGDWQGEDGEWMEGEQGAMGDGPTVDDEEDSRDVTSAQREAEA